MWSFVITRTPARVERIMHYKYRVYVVCIAYAAEYNVGYVGTTYQRTYIKRSMHRCVTYIYIYIYICNVRVLMYVL